MSESNMPETLSQLAESDAPNLRVPRPVKREKVVSAFMDAFDLIGGTPRLAMWADENPGEFFRLWAKLLPKDVPQRDTELIINHVLPRGNLD